MPAEIRPEGLWELPRGWIWARAKEFAHIVGGGTPSNAIDETNFESHGIPWITPADLSKYADTYISRGARSLSNKGFQNSSARIMPKGTLLISSRAPVGYTVVAANEVCTNQGFKSFVFKMEMCPEFFRYYVIFNRKYFIDNASGTTFKEISGNVMSELLFPVPPLAEQRRIVARIDELFTEIADGETALARARNDLATWRRALLKAAVTGELTREWREHNKPNDTAAQMVESVRSANELAIKKGEARRFKFGPPRDDIRFPEIPERWQWIQLGQILAKIDAGLNVKADGRPPRDGETGIVKISAVTWGEFDEEESKTLASDAVIDERNIIRPGDFLISRANTLELVGAPVIVKACTKRLVLSDKVLRLHFFSGLQQWVEVCLKSPFGRHQIESYASGNQLSMRNISQENLLRIAIPLPPRSEIDHALRLLGFNQEQGFDGSISIDNGEKTSAALRQSILKAAFEGRLVEQDPDDEPAELMLTRLDNAAPKQKATPRRVKRPRDVAVGTEA